MVDPTICDIENRPFEGFKEKAAREQMSLEAWQGMTFKEMLMNMPEIDEDIWLNIERQRHEDQPGPVDF